MKKIINCHTLSSFAAIRIKEKDFFAVVKIMKFFKLCIIQQLGQTGVHNKIHLGWINAVTLS